MTRLDRKSLKTLRRLARNKKEFFKAKKFAEEFGGSFMKPDGTFDLRMSQVLSHTFIEDPELAKLCKRCGKCCYHSFPDELNPEIDYMLTKTPCMYMETLNDGTTQCRIYDNQNRMGCDISFGNYCFPRELHKIKIDGCPYNDIIEENCVEWREWKRKGIVK